MPPSDRGPNRRFQSTWSRPERPVNSAAIVQFTTGKFSQRPARSCSQSDIESLGVNDPGLPAPAYSAMAIQSMLTGTGQPIKHTSADVVNSLMGTCDVPTLVADQKKNKAATVPGSISQLKRVSPEIILPTDQKRHVLRSIVSTAVNEIGKEYKTANFPVFTPQLIIALLLQAQNPQKTISQIHRFPGCVDDNELHTVKQLPTKSVSVSHLHNCQAIAYSWLHLRNGYSWLHSFSTTPAS